MIIFKKVLHMSYKIVEQIPAGSQFIGDDEEYIPEGYVSGWGATTSFGKHVKVSKYDTPAGEHLALKRYVIREVTEADAWESLKSAGY